MDSCKDGIIFPFVNNAEIAREIVRACSYPDLGRSIRGRNDGTEMQQVYNDICKRVREKGRFLGAAIGPTPEEAKRVKDLGVQWVVFGQDARALSMALKSNLDALKDF